MEEQLIDRLSFQRFVGINLDPEIPDSTTFWRFQEALSTHNLDERLIELIGEQLEAKSLMVKRVTIVDASILPSSWRPLSDKKRKELAEQSSSQIDTDANSIKKGGTYYFGYKGHIGVDIQSKLIRKVALTPASVHDSTQTEKLISYDEKALFGDNTYADGHHIYSASTTAGTTGCLTKPPEVSRCRVRRKTKPKTEQRSSGRGASVCLDEDQGWFARHASKNET